MTFARRDWGPVDRPSWPPPEEVYCGGCRRMVAASPTGQFAAMHFVFAMTDDYGRRVSGDRPYIRCTGSNIIPGITHGMEVPV